MRIGLSKVDITPPVGCELAGFGHYLGRRSTAVFDPLYAAGLAVGDDGSAAIHISCDLLLLTAPQVAQIRALIAGATGLGADRVVVCCTHTHSGPSTGGFYSLGTPHLPYVENLPWRIAQAGIQAFARRQEATICHAEVPCKDFVYNRTTNPTPDRSAVDEEGWSAQLDGLVDRTAHVVKFMSDKQMVGFCSYYSAHPVVCCEQSHIIHGDFVGVATNRVQQAYRESLGFFLQGACGDINPGYCHNDPETSIRDLEVFSYRYAQVIERGLAEATPIEGDGVAAARKVVQIPQTPPDPDQLEQDIRDIERWLCSEEAERDQRVKNTKVADLKGWRKVRALLDKQPNPVRDVDLVAVRFGGITMVSAPFEVFNAIKSQVQENLRGQRALVLGYANDYIGYAPTASEYEKPGSYPAFQVPRFIGEPPFGPHLEQQLVDEMTALGRQVSAT